MRSFHIIFYNALYFENYPIRFQIEILSSEINVAFHSAKHQRRNFRQNSQIAIGYFQRILSVLNTVFHTI